MIRGKVNRNREVIIELDIVGSNLHEKIEAIIDIRCYKRWRCYY